MDKTELTPEQQDAIDAFKAFSDISGFMNDIWKSQPEGSYAKKITLQAIRRLEVIENKVNERVSEVAPNVDILALVYGLSFKSDDAAAQEKTLAAK